MELFADIIGWIGSFLVVGAYALNSYQVIKPTSAIYQWMNLLGGIFLTVNTVYYTAYPSTFINLVWIVVAVIALIRIQLTRKKERV